MGYFLDVDALEDECLEGRHSPEGLPELDGKEGDFHGGYIVPNYVQSGQPRERGKNCSNEFEDRPFGFANREVVQDRFDALGKPGSLPYERGSNV